MNLSHKQCENKNSIISKYRMECMGAAAIGVLIVHSCGIISYPDFITKMFRFGGVGVYIFMFLSGMGMYFSLKNMEARNGAILFGQFYKKRVCRVVIPYLLIGAAWYAVKYLLVAKSISGFFYELSTAAFWLEHKGAWYVAAIIPIYAVYPLFYKFVETGHREFKTAIMILAVFAVQEYCYLTAPQVFGHLNQVFQSLWIFFLGSYFGKKIFEGSNCYALLIPLCVLPILAGTGVIETYTPINQILYAYYGVFLTVILCIALNLIQPLKIHSVICGGLDFFGQMSLEIYLTNIFLIQAVELFDVQALVSSASLLYAGVVVIGVCVSYLFTRWYSRVTWFS